MVMPSIVARALWGMSLLARHPDLTPFQSKAGKVLVGLYAL